MGGQVRRGPQGECRSITHRDRADNTLYRSQHHQYMYRDELS